jgi:hypothetical protein
VHSVLEKYEPTSGPQSAGNPQINVYFICLHLFKDSVSASEHQMVELSVNNEKLYGRNRSYINSMY